MTEGFSGAVLLVVAVLLYFLPSIIGRDKRNANAILCLNVFLGWTLIGWVIALVWAVSAEEPAQLPPAAALPGYQCPKCKAPVVQNAAGCSACGVAFKATTKKCPDCAEEVKAEARKCRFCGHEFQGVATTAG